MTAVHVLRRAGSRRAVHEAGRTCPGLPGCLSRQTETCGHSREAALWAAVAVAGVGKEEKEQAMAGVGISGA